MTMFPTDRSAATDETTTNAVAHHVSRRRVLGLAGAAGAALVAGPALATARPGAAFASPATPAAAPSAAGALDLWKQYRFDPERHPTVPNVSYAGYRRGEAPLPVLPVVANVKDHGAVGDGVADDTVAINAAIEAAGTAGGGAVLLPAGTYRTTGIIRVHHSNVVIRSEGKAATTIYGEQSLYDSYFPNVRGNVIQWSFMGGLVWFIPKSHLETLRANTFFGVEGWTETASRGRIVNAARRGDRRLQLDTAQPGLKAGDKVLVCLDNVADSSLLKHLCGNVPGTETYDWAKLATRLRPEISDWTGAPNFAQLRYPVEVKGVWGTEVRLVEPLRFDLKPEWNPRLTTLGETITGSGIEDLTIRMRETPQPVHNKEFGFNGPCFQTAVDCWAKNVHLENVDNGFGLVSAKNVTIVDASISGRYAHHPFMARVQSSDNLIANFTIDSETRHGVNSEGLSFGNVWTEGVMNHGTFDSHKLIPLDSVRTSITVTNDGFTGGSADAGPVWGRRIAMWNVDVRNGRGHGIRVEEHAPYSAVVGVRGTTELTDHPRDFPGPVYSTVQALDAQVAPANLYLAQFRLRTGSSSTQVRESRGAKA